MAKNAIAALLLAGGVAATGSGAALAADSGYTLGRVTFVGNEKVSTEDLMAALPFQPGQKVDRAGLQADIDAVSAAYQKHNVGANIQAKMAVTNHKALVTITIAEQAAVAPEVRHVGNVADTVAVQGNKKVSTAAILAAAKIQPGGPLTQDSLAAAQNAVVALYHEKNIGVSVGIDFSNAGQPGHLNVVIKVAEKDDE